MSPAAAALAALLHAAVAAALLWESPWRHTEAAEQAIEFTVDLPQPTAEPQVPAPAEPAAAQVPRPAPNPTPTPPPRLGLEPPRSLTPDPSAKPAAPEPPPATTATTEPPKPEPPAVEPAKPEPEQQQAAAAPPPPPPPPEPKLEEVLPPVEAPPPPLAARDFPKSAPVKPPPAPPPPQRAPAPQQPPHLQPSPLARAPQRPPPAESQGTSQPAPSALVNPASQYGQRKAQDDYLWQVMRKISQYHYVPKSNVVSESGVVVMQITVARDGRLLNVSLSKSSGYPTLDNGVMDTVRQASPFPVLPPEIPGAQHTFILPVNYAYRGGGR